MSFTLPGKFILAPMANVTDVAFRKQCKDRGAALTVTELTSVEGIVRKEKKLLDLLDVVPGERPAIQLFGHDIDVIVKAAKIVEPLASMIDFNLGCPAPHITRQQCGSALLMHPDHLKELFSSLVRALNIPVTAKIRAGPSDKVLVYKKIGLALQDAGVSMVTLHPRTVKDGYSGTADWQRIRELKELLHIPVCGNGDVTSPEKAIAMLKETGCDFVMIGRGAFGNPFIFSQSVALLDTGSYTPTSEESQHAACLEYIEEAVNFGVPFSRIKLQVQHYSKGLLHAKDIRRSLSTVKTIAELYAVLQKHYILRKEM